jgi:signal transduction histidine kinase
VSTPPATDRRRDGTVAVPVAACVVVVSLVASVLAVAVDVRTAGTPVPASAGLASTWLDAVPGLMLVVPGALLQRRLPRHPIAWVLLLSGLLWSVDSLAGGWLVYAAFTSPGAPLAGAALWIYFRLGSALLLGLPILLILFPDGRLLEGRWRVAALASLAGTALLPVLSLVVPSAVAQRYHGRLPPPLDSLMPDPLSVSAPYAVWRAALTAAYVLLPLGLVVPFAVILHRYRRADRSRRAQLRWLLWAALADMLVLLVARLVPDPIASGLIDMTFALTSFAIVVAVTRYHLYAIDRLLSATLVYGLLSAAVVAVDIAVFAAAGTVLGQRSAALAAVAVVGIAYAPLRQRLWTAVRRVVRGSRDDPYAVVSALAQRLEASTAPDEQVLAVARAVAKAFGSPYVRVEIDQAHGGRLVVEHGRASGREVPLPVTYRGQPVGLLVLQPAVALSDGDQRLLGDMVRQVAAAARATALSVELQRSREQLVLAREEERRRLRRDLHDGLGPHLGAVTLRIETARNLAATEPGRADALLEAATHDVASILADVRRVVHDLRPPALDELGLLGAVRQQVTRFSDTANGLDIRVTCDAPLDGLPAAVEVAAYRIAIEAITNVVRHAKATRCTVRLSIASPADSPTATDAPATLQIEVHDDGVGIAADTPAGIGLVSQRERAAELGGTCEVTCAPDTGTHVLAVLPIR